jgi:hypothetical protein
MPTTTNPLAEVLTTLARAELDQETPDINIGSLVATLTPRLDDDKRELWWGELLRCLERAAATRESGPAFDEAGVDWDERAAEALEFLTGTK